MRKNMGSLGNRLPLLLLLIVTLVAALAICLPTGDDDADDNDDYFDVMTDDYEQEEEEEEEQEELSRRGMTFPKLGLTTGCGGAPARKRLNKRIIDGVNVTYGEFPSYVRLTIGDKKSNDCGGTLISDRHVLTAAHCLDKMLDGEPLRVRLADHQLGHKDTFEVVVRANQTFCNDPLFFETTNKTVHDWIVILLKKKIQFTDYIQPACLPRAAPTTFGQLSRCYQVGMGAMGFENYEKPPEQSVEVAVRSKWLQKVRVEQVACPHTMNVTADDPSRVCYRRADERVGPFACFGDSGGPVLCQDDQDRWTVVAITSYMPYSYCGTHPSRPKRNYPTVFANVVRLLPEMDERCKYVLAYSPPSPT